MNPAWIDFIICFFFGMLGVHRFRLAQFGYGILYFLTFGLFGIGWIIDCVRYFLVALSGHRIVAAYGFGRLVTVPVAPRAHAAAANAPYAQPNPASSTVAPAGFLLKHGESIVYKGPAAFVSMDEARHTSSGGGGMYPGMIAVTTERIMFTGVKGAFDKKITSLTSTTQLAEGLSLQFGHETFPFQTSHANEICAAISQVVNAR